MDESHVTLVCLRQWTINSPAGNPGGRPPTPAPQLRIVVMEVKRRSYGQVVREVSVINSGGAAILVALADTGAATSLLTKDSADKIRLCINDSDIELT